MRTVSHDEWLKLRAPGHLVEQAREMAGALDMSLSEFTRQAVRAQIRRTAHETGRLGVSDGTATEVLVSDAGGLWGDGT